jgi:hypothetical protein
MKTHKWSVLEQKMSPERRARVQAKVDDEIQVMNIRRLPRGARPRPKSRPLRARR